MNWKLILNLSLFGLLMAFATVFWVSSAVEPYCWLVIALACGYFIASFATSRFFLHGFMVSMVNCVWITAVHMMLSVQYLANHPKEAEQYALLNKQLGLSVKQAMLIFGPFIGIISGVVFGLFAVLASKVVKR